MFVAMCGDCSLKFELIQDNDEQKPIKVVEVTPEEVYDSVFRFTITKICYSSAYYKTLCFNKKYYHTNILQASLWKEVKITSIIPTIPVTIRLRVTTQCKQPCEYPHWEIDDVEMCSEKGNLISSIVQLL